MEWCDTEGEDDALLRQLLQKFEGQPEELAKTVENIAKMTMEMAETAGDGAEAGQKEERAAGGNSAEKVETTVEKTEGGSGAGPKKRYPRPLRKAIFGYD